MPRSLKLTLPNNYGDANDPEGMTLVIDTPSTVVRDMNSGKYYLWVTKPAARKLGRELAELYPPTEGETES
jgi:hypothetical protein